MQKKHCSNFFFSLFCFAVSFGVLFSEETINSHKCVSGELIVKLKKGVAKKSVGNFIWENNIKIKKKYDCISNIHGQEYILIKSDMTTSEMMEKLKNNGDIEKYNPNWYYELEAGPITNDPYIDSQWALHNTGQNGGTVSSDIKAPEAWSSFTHGSNSVYIAIIDSGVDYNNPDLSPNLDNSLGYDFAGDVNGGTDSDPYPNGNDAEWAHGTVIAGIIGAKGNNYIGISGTCWDVRMLMLKVQNPDKLITNDAIDDALQYVLSLKQNNVNIVAVNISIGGGSYDEAMRQHIIDLGSVGVLVITSAGNSRVGQDNDIIEHYPSGYMLPNMINVANTNESDQLHLQSNYGRSSVHLAAPGTNIYSSNLSATPFGNCGFGSSYSTAFVTGAAALMASYYPNESAIQRKERILNGVDIIQPLSTKLITSGRLNLYKSLTWGQPLAPTIDEHPQSQPVGYNESATLYVYASGPTPLSYQWYQGNSGDTTNLIPGANSNVYTTPPLTNPTSYWVRVSNPHGSTDSNTAYITIASADTITVTSPNGGENWAVGSRHAITWTTCHTDARVNISYYNVNAPLVQNSIVQDVSTANGTTNGSYQWVVPNDVGNRWRIQITGANYSGSDDSNANFAISAPPAGIHVTLPNGGETWQQGARHTVTWTALNVNGNVAVKLCRTGYADVTLGTVSATDGIFYYSVPNTQAVAANYKIKVQAASGGTNDTSDSFFSVAGVTSPAIAFDRPLICFGSLVNGTPTPPAHVELYNTGSDALNWTANSSSTWLQVVPASGVGDATLSVSVTPSGLAAGTYTGWITVTDAGAINSPQAVKVVLTVKTSGTNPFGYFDIPENNSTGITGSIPVSGWALDDIEVTNLKIYRNSVTGEPSGLVFLGDGLFIEGSRPDVEAAYPTTPNADRSGWGYNLLTNTMPNEGNGTFTLTAKATDREGHTVTIGSKTITCDNANATAPFGTIDTPTPGETTSGNAYANWGWALTPLPSTIPTDGSSIWVYVDGTPLGHPLYNLYRQDVATTFPGLNNSNGAVGVFNLNTTGFSNGIHSICWSVTDDNAHTSGIGSRWFYISNSGAPFSLSHFNQDTSSSSRYLIPEDASQSLTVKTGFKKTEKTVGPSKNGDVSLEMNVNEPLVLIFPGEKGEKAFSRKPRMRINDILRVMPAGSMMDARNGTFSWMPGPGFYGSYPLEFLQETGGRLLRHKVTVQVGWDKDKKE